MQTTALPIEGRVHPLLLERHSPLLHRGAPLPARRLRAHPDYRIVGTLTTATANRA